MAFFRYSFLFALLHFFVFCSSFGQDSHTELPQDSLAKQIEELNDKAVRLIKQNKQEEAEETLIQAIALYDSLGVKNDELLFGLYSDLSYMYSPFQFRRPDRQLFYLNKAKEVLNLDKVSPYRAGNFYLDLASLAIDRGKNEEALGYSQKSFDVYVQQEERSIEELGLANVFLLKGVALEWVTKSYKRLKDEEKMLKTYEELAKLRKTALPHIDLKNSISVSAFEIGRYYQDNHLEKAVFYFDQSIAFAPNEGSKLYPTICKGFAYLDGEKPNEARKVVEKLLRLEGLNIFGQLNVHELAARTYGELGIKEKLIFHTNEALTLMNEKGLEVDVQNFVVEDFVHFDRLKYPILLTQFATFLEMAEDPKLDQTAQNLFRMGLNLFASRIDHQPLDEKLANYEIIQHRLLSQLSNEETQAAGQKELVLEMEKIETQARFNELLSNRSLSLQQSKLDSLFKAENDIRQSITQLKRKGEDSLIAKQIFDQELRLTEIKEKLAEENKAVFELANSAFQSMELPQPAQTGLLKFVVARARLFRIWLHGGEMTVADLGPYDDVEQKIDSFLLLLKMPSKENAFRTIGKELYQDLLAGVDIEAKTIVIASKALRYLPFELLQKGDSYLLEETAISYANGLMYLSEDIFPSFSHRQSISFFAPSYQAYSPSKAELAVRGEAYDLSGAREEVLSLSRLLGGEVYEAEEASKKNFMDLPPDYSIIHVAGHAYLDDEDPELSNLVFSDLEEDNKLYISELYGFKSNADLAVLSACNSGVGGFKSGKGMVSLSEAFLYAGIPATVSSLWSAPDQATKEIMISFYGYLKDGLPKSVALQQAKKDYIQQVSNPKLAHPYYWAPFVLYGNDAPIEIKTANTPWVYWLGLILGVLAVGTYGLYRRKAKNA